MFTDFCEEKPKKFVCVGITEFSLECFSLSRAGCLSLDGCVPLSVVAMTFLVERMYMKSRKEEVKNKIESVCEALQFATNNHGYAIKRALPLPSVFHLPRDQV